MQTNLLLNSIVNGINGWRKERISRNMRASVGRGEKKETKSERGRERERARETEGTGEGITRYKLACQGKTYGTSYTVI